jgi:hypothetical protein
MVLADVVLPRAGECSGHLSPVAGGTRLQLGKIEVEQKRCPRCGFELGSDLIRFCPAPASVIGSTNVR